MTEKTEFTITEEAAPQLIEVLESLLEFIMSFEVEGEEPLTTEEIIKELEIIIGTIYDVQGEFREDERILH